MKLKQESAMNLTNKARSLRKNQTDVEQVVWKHLRNRHLYNYQFRRQFPIEPYVTDIACLELKLINIISPHPTLSLRRVLILCMSKLCA